MQSTDRGARAAAAATSSGPIDPGSFSAMLASIVQNEGDAAASQAHLSPPAVGPAGVPTLFPGSLLDAAPTLSSVSTADVLQHVMALASAPTPTARPQAAGKINAPAGQIPDSGGGAWSKTAGSAHGHASASLPVATGATPAFHNGALMQPFPGTLDAGGIDPRWHIPFPDAMALPVRPGAPSQLALSAAAAALAPPPRSAGLPVAAALGQAALPHYLAAMPTVPLPPGADLQLLVTAGMPTWPAPALPPPPGASDATVKTWSEAADATCALCAAELPPAGGVVLAPCGAIGAACCAGLAPARGLRLMTRTLRPSPLCVHGPQATCGICMRSYPAAEVADEPGRFPRKICHGCHLLVHQPQQLVPQMGAPRAPEPPQPEVPDAVPPSKPPERRGQAPAAPAGLKGCVLCRKQFTLDHFGKGGNGKLNGYCRPCQVLVVRGNRKGLRAAQLRQALEDGTLDTLLPPVTQRSKSQKIDQPTTAGMKRCGMCLQELTVDQFDKAKDGNLRGYCHACHCLVGRANKKGIKASELRQAIAEGRLETILPPVKEKMSRVSAAADGDGAAQRGACHLCSKALTREQMDKSSPAWLRGYCVTCHRLVGKAGRQGVKLDALREAIDNGTVDTLLSGEVPAAKPRPQAPPGQKGCQLCLQVLPVEQFGIVGNNRRRGYCQKCHLLSGRANKRGIRVSQLRDAIQAGTVDELLPPLQSARSDGAGAMQLQGPPGAAPPSLPGQPGWPQAPGYGPAFLPGDDGQPCCSMCRQALDEGVAGSEGEGAALRPPLCKSCEDAIARSCSQGFEAQALPFGLPPIDAGVPGAPAFASLEQQGAAAPEATAHPELPALPMAPPAVPLPQLPPSMLPEGAQPVWDPNPRSFGMLPDSVPGPPPADSVGGDSAANHLSAGQPAVDFSAAGPSADGQASTPGVGHDISVDGVATGAASHAQLLPQKRARAVEIGWEAQPTSGSYGEVLPLAEPTAAFDFQQADGSTPTLDGDGVDGVRGGFTANEDAGGKEAMDSMPPRKRLR